MWTAASPGLCCLWGPPSTWMALPSMRPWPPSSSLKSTTTSSTWVRSQLSGELALGGTCQQLRPKKSLAWLGVLEGRESQQEVKGAFGCWKGDVLRGAGKNKTWFLNSGKIQSKEGKRHTDDDDDDDDDGDSVGDDGVDYGVDSGDDVDGADSDDGSDGGDKGGDGDSGDDDDGQHL